MAKKDNYEISGPGLENLLAKVLEHCEKDIEEAEQNIAFYKAEVMNNPLGKEQYGHFLNDALKIKGQTRDRFIKVVNLVKDRVKVKEIFENAAGSDDSPEKLLKAIDNYFEDDND